MLRNSLCWMELQERNPAEREGFDPPDTLSGMLVFKSGRREASPRGLSNLDCERDGQNGLRGLSVGSLYSQLCSQPTFLPVHCVKRA